MSSSYAPYYDHDGITIYNGDCFDVLSNIDISKVDLMLTDPPYGINWQGHQMSTLKWDGIANDCGELDIQPILKLPVQMVVFGLEDMLHKIKLPSKGRWICWDKRVDPKADAMIGSAFELAWTNKDSGYYKIYRCMHGGVVNANGGSRMHPTEKPIQVLEDIIKSYKDIELVFDPFMGSGTTLKAAHNLGIKAIGIEIDTKHCESAVKRLSQCRLDL